MNQVRYFVVLLFSMLWINLSLGFQGGSYLESLSQAHEQKENQMNGSTSAYLSSLSQRPESTANSNEYTPQDKSNSVTILSSEATIFDLEKTAANTPDDHYAKNHPGAGWAGYKHPEFGGYLDNLKENNWEEGKVADYGADIRWGAQVYLDALK